EHREGDDADGEHDADGLNGAAKSESEHAFHCPWVCVWPTPLSAGKGKVPEARCCRDLVFN
ncbi:hypothetical protein, partial [Bradyrhizobium sp. 137]|uniref:hypothetical protein n=1 Tax=Bradyrhizobium sp. 137 TaxID=2782614 RepID=UPI001FFBF721